MEKKKNFLLILLSCFLTVVLLAVAAFFVWETDPKRLSRQGGTLTVPDSETVWIPQTGRKYHGRKICGNMQDPVEISRKEAERQGYEPCKLCYRER